MVLRNCNNLDIVTVETQENLFRSIHSWKSFCHQIFLFAIQMDQNLCRISWREAQKSVRRQYFSTIILYSQNCFRVEVEILCLQKPDREHDQNES